MLSYQRGPLVADLALAEMLALVMFWSEGKRSSHPLLMARADWWTSQGRAACDLHFAFSRLSSKDAGLASLLNIDWLPVHRDGLRDHRMKPTPVASEHGPRRPYGRRQSRLASTARIAHLARVETIQWLASSSPLRRARIFARHGEAAPSLPSCPLSGSTNASLLLLDHTSSTCIGGRSAGGADDIEGGRQLRRDATRAAARIEKHLDMSSP